VVEAKVAVSPEPAVAAIVKGAIPKATLPSCGKVIV
jgi:hypothetical protein